MPVLTSAQRNTLEKAVVQARKLATTGAHNALRALAVNEPEPFKHMAPEQRSLRNRLRAKGRLLGDKLDNGTQDITHLAYELAYEYWHKMLFAQFLEANNLLMHPGGAAVTLEECEELAREEGYANKWVAAAAYASRELPAIFRVNDPLMEVEFAPNDRIALESLLEGLDQTIYTADDALGWVYQFWQSEEKTTINASGDKIDGEKLPAVTQLFTEPYMVHFLIDNTIGAWWVGHHPGQTPPVKFEYLRLLDNGTPAAGTFEGWPKTTAEVTVMDPCMGSGHFLASLFTIFTRLRMAEENLTKEEAASKVILENLHGLELDARCTQLAAFNLAFTAWKFCGHYMTLPEMHLACSGIAPKGKKDDWVKLVGQVKDPTLKARLENGMYLLYGQFQLAPEIGSLLDPSNLGSQAMAATFEELQPVLEKALAAETDQDQVERGVLAAGMAKAGQLLTKRYTLQITNVPYLARGKQDKTLADYAQVNYPESKADLANMFLERMLRTTARGGTATVVIPQNWLFLTSYKKLREKLLKNESWDFIARLGSGAFSQISGEVVKAILISITHSKPAVAHQIAGLDVSEAINAAAKEEALRMEEIKLVNQMEQLGNPDKVVALVRIVATSLLNKFAYSHHGLTSGDLPRMSVFFWEIRDFAGIWIPFQTTTRTTQLYGGLEAMLRWNYGRGAIDDLPGARKDGTAAWGKKGVIVSQMGNMPASIYLGYAFDNNTAVITPNDESNLGAIWAYCSSENYNKNVRVIDQSLAVTSATMAKVPFDLHYWKHVASNKFPRGIPRPYTDDQTQLLFHGHPMYGTLPLQITVARLLNYHWPAEHDNELELAEEARELIEQIKSFDQLSDQDGIVCIPPVNNEPAAAESLRNYLKQVWGKLWSNHTVEELLRKEGSTKTNLEDWLHDEFFVQHCKVFQNRPFIWHIWDGRKDGFSALVNYHKLTKENLQKLIYTYLGDWIHQCESRVRTGKSGAEGQLQAAKELKQKLELILEGEPPYDIFVRWKKLEEQPIGWDPDLNDGVRLNIRPFVEASVLRKNPNIKWGIDRGKNPPGGPWGEKRDNDLHLSLAEKREARASTHKSSKE